MRLEVHQDGVKEAISLEQQRAINSLQLVKLK